MDLYPSVRLSTFLYSHSEPSFGQVASHLTKKRIKWHLLMGRTTVFYHNEHTFDTRQGWPHRHSEAAAGRTPPGGRRRLGNGDCRRADHSAPGPWNRAAHKGARHLGVSHREPLPASVTDQMLQQIREERDLAN